MLRLLTVSLMCIMVGAQDAPLTDAFVSAGRHFSFVGEKGVVRGAGRNDRGQLGNGGTEHKVNLTDVHGFQEDHYVVDVSAGAFHAIFLTDQGEVFATGWNRFGQLALGDHADRTTPVRITSLPTVVAVSAGYAHSLFLAEDGQVWGAGLNSMGQLGDSTTTNRNEAVMVTGMDNCSSVSAGYDFSVFLHANSEAWAAGNGLGGQLGDGQLSVSAEPVRALSNVAAISAGESHALFLKIPENPHRQVVMATGANFDGQLGDGTTYRKATPVEIEHFEDFNAMAAGGDGSCFSSGTDLQLRCAGSNRNGQLGLGAEPTVLLPREVTGSVGSVLKMAVGDAHSLFLHYGSPSGRVYSTGSNDYGQLGDGTTTSQNEPIEVATVDVTPTTRAPTPPPTPAPTSPPTPAPSSPDTPAPTPAAPTPTPDPTLAPTPDPTRAPAGDTTQQLAFWAALGGIVVAVLGLGVFFLVQGGEAEGTEVETGERDLELIRATQSQ